MKRAVLPSMSDRTFSTEWGERKRERNEWVKTGQNAHTRVCGGIGKAGRAANKVAIARNV